MLIEFGFKLNHPGMTRETYKETPITDRLRDEDKSTVDKDDSPTATSIPNITRPEPPMTGSGIDVIIAPNLPTSAKNIAINPAATITIRLAICEIHLKNTITSRLVK